jgi:hypothetical protein
MAAYPLVRGPVRASDALRRCIRPGTRAIRARRTAGGRSKCRHQGRAPVRSPGSWPTQGPPGSCRARSLPDAGRAGARSRAAPEAVRRPARNAWRARIGRRRARQRRATLCGQRSGSSPAARCEAHRRAPRTSRRGLRRPGLPRDRGGRRAGRRPRLGLRLQTRPLGPPHPQRPPGDGRTPGESRGAAGRTRRWCRAASVVWPVPADSSRQRQESGRFAEGGLAD